MRHLKARLALTVVSGATIAAGLGARKFFDGPLAKYLGVALWAVLVYWLVLLVRPTIPVRTAAAVALAISWGVEFGQLTPVPAWLSSQHTILRLIFGTTFHPPDLLALLAGVALAAAAHALVAPVPTRRPVYPV